MNDKIDFNDDSGDDDLDSLLAESLLISERKKALKKINRDKTNSRLLTEGQKELLQQEENFKWTDERYIIHKDLHRCTSCGMMHTEIRGFYVAQSRVNSPGTKRLVAINYHDGRDYINFVTEKVKPFCDDCLPNPVYYTTIEELPILKGLL